MVNLITGMKLFHSFAFFKFYSYPMPPGSNPRPQQLISLIVIDQVVVIMLIQTCYVLNNTASVFMLKLKCSVSFTRTK